MLSPLLSLTGDNPLIAMKMANEEYDPQHEQPTWNSAGRLSTPTGCRKETGFVQL